MKMKKTYIKPESEIIGIRDSFMLDLSIYGIVVDDEAANDSFFNENDSFFDD